MEVVKKRCYKKATPFFNYLLCDPSQNGPLPVCLQAHKYAVLLSSAVKTIGAIPLPLCEPSQYGCLLDKPHAHHAYFFPSSNSIAIGALPALVGVVISLFFREYNSFASTFKALSLHKTTT